MSLVMRIAKDTCSNNLRIVALNTVQCRKPTFNSQPNDETHPWNILREPHNIKPRNKRVMGSKRLHSRSNRINAIWRGEPPNNIIENGVWIVRRHTTLYFSKINWHINRPSPNITKDNAINISIDRETRIVDNTGTPFQTNRAIRVQIIKP